MYMLECVSFAGYRIDHRTTAISFLNDTYMNNVSMNVYLNTFSLTFQIKKLAYLYLKMVKKNEILLLFVSLIDVKMTCWLTNICSTYHCYNPCFFNVVLKHLTLISIKLNTSHNKIIICKIKCLLYQTNLTISCTEIESL